MLYINLMLTVHFYSLTHIHKIHIGWIFPLEVYKRIMHAPEQAPTPP